MDKKVVYIGDSLIRASVGCSISQDFECLKGFTPVQSIVIDSLQKVVQESGVEVNDAKTTVIISTTKGDVAQINENFEACYLWRIAQALEQHFGLSQRPQIISTACISGVAAISLGARMIEDGRRENVYVIGVDLMSEFISKGFESFKSVSKQLCRPYDKSRDGITIGEGCAVLLLSSDEKKSKSKIVLRGCGLSNDANHISGPSRDGSGLYLAIKQAFKDAGVESSDIDYVNLHGTGTLFNDDMESKAMALAGLSKTPCNSLKPYFGHTFGASGVIETILVVEQMLEGKVYATRGFEELGTPCELSVSAEHRAQDITYALKTASGFGGTNAAIVLSREVVKKAQDEPKCIEQIAHLEIDSANVKIPFAEFIKQEYRDLDDKNLKFFKMDALSKLGYIASCKLLRGLELDLPSHRVAILLANRSSSLDTDRRHQAIVDEHLSEGASPAVFVYTLPNIVAGEIAIKHKFMGELLFFIEPKKDMHSMAEYARKIINQGVCDAVLFGWCELLGETYNVELKLIKKI